MGGIENDSDAISAPAAASAWVDGTTATMGAGGKE
jgi:hypothetical protein